MAKGHLTGNAQKELQRLNAAITQYRQMSRRAPHEVLARKAKRVGYRMRVETMKLAPERGQIAREAAAIQYRIRIRPSIRRRAAWRFAPPNTPQGKRRRRRTKAQRQRGRRQRTWMVKRELHTRERGRKFLGTPWLAPSKIKVRRDEPAQGYLSQRSKHGQRPIVGEVRTDASDRRPSITLGSHPQGTLSIERRKGIAARALRAETNDTLRYLARKQKSAFKGALQRR